MRTGEGQWKPASDPSLKGVNSVLPAPPRPQAAQPAGRQGRFSPCSEAPGEEEAPEPEGAFRPLGILCVLLAGEG